MDPHLDIDFQNNKDSENFYTLKIMGYNFIILQKVE